MPLSGCGGVFCSCLLQFSWAMSSPSGAVSTLIGLFRFAGPALSPITARAWIRRLAAAVKLDQIKGREGLITKGTVVVLSNVRKGEGRDNEVTSILWTLWGKQAENAHEALGSVI